MNVDGLSKSLPVSRTADRCGDGCENSGAGAVRAYGSSRAASVPLRTTGLADQSDDEATDSTVTSRNARRLGNGVTNRMWRAGWRVYGWFRRLSRRRPARDDQFVSRRWKEIREAYDRQNAAIVEIAAHRASPGRLAELQEALEAEAEAFSLCAWYYEQHGDDVAAFACENWAERISSTPTWAYLLERYRGRPVPSGKGHDRD